jgi:hypothetical protein
MRLICDTAYLNPAKSEAAVMCIINEEIISMMDGIDIKKHEKRVSEGDYDEVKTEVESDEEVLGHLNHKISL